MHETKIPLIILENTTRKLNGINLENCFCNVYFTNRGNFKAIKDYSEIIKLDFDYNKNAYDFFFINAHRLIDKYLFSFRIIINNYTHVIIKKFPSHYVI